MTPTQKWLTGLALVAGMAVPALAQAQDVRRYDGYCYVKQQDAKRNGLVIGAVAGGLLGSQVSKNERGLGAVIGAVAGGALGQNIGKNSVKCYNGEYYSYQGNYYDPPAGPSGESGCTSSRTTSSAPKGCSCRSGRTTSARCRSPPGT